MVASQSQGPLEAQLNEKPHAKKLEAEESLFCDICQIRCASFDNMKEHLASKKHQSRVKRVGQDRGFFKCEICGIGCSDKNALDTHLKGQKHTKIMLKLARANTDFYAKV